MVASIKYPDLFRVKNKFAHDIYTKRLESIHWSRGVEPIRLFVSLVLSIMMSKLILDPE
jgi:hypothetical protein